MKKRFYDIMVANTMKEIRNAPLELVSNYVDSAKDNTTGEITYFIKVEAVVPKKCGSFSGCRISVKLPNGPLKVSQEAQ